MPRAQIIMEISGDEAKAIASMQKVIDKQRDQIESMRQSGEETRRTGGAFRQAFGSQALNMLKSFATALGITGGIAGAIQTVRREMEEVERTQSRMLRSQLAIADPQRAFFRNFQGTIAEQDLVRKQVDRISREQAVKPSDLYGRLSAAYSAPHETIQQVLDAVEASAKIMPELPEEGARLASSMLAIGEFTGTKDAMANLAFIAKTAGPSAVREWGQVAETMAPQLMAFTEIEGTKPQEAAALYSVLTQYASETTGKKVSTGGINLADQLREFFGERYEMPTEEAPEKPERPERPKRQYRSALEARNAELAYQERLAEYAEDVAEWEERMADYQARIDRAGQLKRGPVPHGTAAMIRRLQQEPELREAFLGEMHLEAQLKPAVRALLRGDDDIRRMYEENLASYGQGMAELKEQFEKSVLPGITTGGLQTVAGAHRAAEAARERIESRFPLKAMIASVREHYGPLLKDAGYGWLDTELAKAATYQDLTGMVDELEEAADYLEKTWRGEPKRQPAKFPGTDGVDTPNLRYTPSSAPAEIQPEIDETVRTAYAGPFQLRRAGRPASSQPPAPQPVDEYSPATQAPTAAPAAPASPPATARPAPGSQPATAQQTDELIRLMQEQNALLRDQAARRTQPLSSPTRDK